VEAYAVFQDGQWTVEVRRRLDTGHPDDKPLREGEVYTLGLAIHDNNVAGRQHYVSFPRTLGIGVKADIEAVKLP